MGQKGVLLKVVITGLRLSIAVIVEKKISLKIDSCELGSFIIENKIISTRFCASRRKVVL